jgi:hypothetical protein
MTGIGPRDGAGSRHDVLLGTDVFIPYAREDRPFVGRLHDAFASTGQ